MLWPRARLNSSRGLQTDQFAPWREPSAQDLTVIPSAEQLPARRKNDAITPKVEKNLGACPGDLKPRRRRCLSRVGW